MAVRRNKKPKRSKAATSPGGQRRYAPAAKRASSRNRARSRKEPRRAGVLRFDSEGWRLPEALAEAGETESNGLLPGRVVSVIAILAIVFIAIMAWFVSQMPEK